MGSLGSSVPLEAATSYRSRESRVLAIPPVGSGAVEVVLVVEEAASMAGTGMSRVPVMGEL